MLGYLKQSTASQTRLIGPFIDDTDFKTPETGLTIANTDIKLSANGGTVFNKTSGGATHITTGMWAITLDATDTATVGELGVAVNVAGALPVYAKFVVLEEAIYDALFAASATGFNASGQVVVASTAAGAITATSIATGAIDADALATDAVTEITDAILAKAYESTETIGQYLRLSRAVLMGITSGQSTATGLFKAKDGTTTRITATTDANGNRTGITISDPD